MFTSDEVIDRFRAETGDRLAADPELSTTAVEELNFGGHGLRPPPPLLARYGRFKILILAHPEKTLRLGLGLSGIRPDRRGIYWLRREGRWLAYSRYGRNVLLGWFDASGKGHVDSRWHRLDDALRSLG